MDNNYNEVQYATMRTSFLTAFPKIFTDIEFSVDIFKNMKELAINSGFSFLTNHFSCEMSVEIEARHKSLNRALDKYINKDTLIIEIAAGLSPRHLQYENCNYYELDFSPVIDIKRDVYTAMGYGKLNSSLYGLDINDLKSLRKCINEIVSTKEYDRVIIVNEGLFWYLTKEQIKNITTKFNDLFTNKDWIWITSDCPTEEKSEEEYRNIISDSAKSKRGTFIDYNDFTDFFKQLGLYNVRYKLSDYLNYEDLSSAKLLSFDKAETMKKINTYTDIAILSPKEIQ